MGKILTLLAIFAILHVPSAFALDKDDEDALKDTQKVLTDEEALKAFTKDNKDAAGAVNQVNKLTNGNKAQNAEVNAISSDIFTDMVKSTNGDSAQIQEKLQQALKDPAAFMNSLTPEQQARIRGLASEIDKQNANNKKPEAATLK